MKTRFFGTAVVGLIGAIIGSFSMMLFASSHFANVAGPGNTPPIVSAAPIVGGGSDQDRIVNAVKRVQPSVVAINVTINGQRYVPVDPFSQFFGGPTQTRPQRFRANVSGSGFVFSRSGYIVTNAHVVTGGGQGTPSKIEVVFFNNDRRTAHLVSANVGVDLALIKVDGYDRLPPPLDLANSDSLSAGQWAIAIGEPLELKQTVTVGVVSGFNRNEAAGNEQGGGQIFKGLLQTSAPINPGNSGGPLVDIEGHVIGVNQLTANPQEAQGIGFAIPSNLVKLTVGSLEKTTGISQGTNQGFLGIATGALTQNVRAQINYLGKGVVVAQVTPGSPADQAGLQLGDVVQKIDGRDITKPEDLVAAIKGMKPGQTIQLQVWTSGQQKTISVKIAERPTSADFQVQQQQQQQQQQQP